MQHLPHPDRNGSHTPQGAEARRAGAELPHTGSVLPQVPSREEVDSKAVVTPDGALCVGLFKIPTEKLSARLRDAGRLVDLIPRTFPTIETLQRALVDDNIQVPPGAIDFPVAFQSFKRAMEGSLRGGRFTDTARTIDRLPIGQGVSASVLSELRSTLVEAARVATVCVGIDTSHFDVVTHRSPLQRGKDWLVDKVGKTKIQDPRIRARFTKMPFEDFRPMELRVDADLWAQRLSLADDGSGFIRRVCAAEHYVAEILSKGNLERRIRAYQGGLEGVFRVFSSDSPDLFFSTELKVVNVFAALQLGQSASRLITRLGDEKVDLVRLCRFVDRDAALGVKANLERLSPQAHARLDDIDAWASRFDRDDTRVLSAEDRHDLAVLLLDAELCLYIAGHLHNVVGGEHRRSFWQSMWSASVRDRDVSCGIELANTLPRPLSNDCYRAADVVTNAAILLGFSGEDREMGAAWRVPENPLMSLTWAMNRADSPTSI